MGMAAGSRVNDVVPTTTAKMFLQVFIRFYPVFWIFDKPCQLYKYLAIYKAGILFNKGCMGMMVSF
jgi:hypothetical protein